MNFDQLHSLPVAYFDQTLFKSKQLGKQIKKKLKTDTRIALIGIVSDEYKTEADNIRKEIYQLYQPSRSIEISDLGNFHFDNETQNFSKLKEVLTHLIQQNILPICFGESEKFLLAMRQVLVESKVHHSVGMIHSRFLLSENKNEQINDQNYLSQLYNSEPNYLLNFTYFGLQNYFVNPEDNSKHKDCGFDSIRLGEIRDDIQEIEPHIRSLDILSIDIQSIRHSDSMQSSASPNGLYAEELAQLMRYAGMSDQLKCIGFFGYKNENLLAAKLFAQAIYCLIDGITERKGELPNEDSQQFQRFIVQNDGAQQDIVFLKSAKSGRWWLEIPKEKTTLERALFIPCSHRDYETALRGELPERWINGFNK